MKLKQMERFDELISPLSWFFLFFGFLPLILFIFRPSFLEYMVFFVADCAAFLVVSRIDRSLFLKIYPDSTIYFLGIESDALARCTLVERVSMFQSMLRFPARRALYCAAVSFVKGIPGTLIIILYWKHSTSILVTTAEATVCALVMYSYFYGAVFIENHSLVSRKIAGYHAKYDWTDVFREVELPSLGHDFDAPEVVGLVSIWFFVLILEWVLITGGVSHSPSGLATLVICVGVAGLALISRIWFLGRKYFVGGLEGIFGALAKFEPDSFHKTLPLHSSAVLGHFEKVFNALMERLRAYREELFRWISYQAEDSRFQALGEISALIVHDLSAPIHVIQFCAQELLQNPDLVKDPRYLEMLSMNGKRSLELIDTLRTYLRGPSVQDSVSNFGEAYRDALRFVEGQVSHRDLARIQIYFDASLSSRQFEDLRKAISFTYC